MEELIKVNNETLELAEVYINEIKNVEIKMKELESIQKEYKTKLLEVMETNKVK